MKNIMAKKCYPYVHFYVHFLRGVWKQRNERPTVLEAVLSAVGTVLRLERHS